MIGRRVKQTTTSRNKSEVSIRNQSLTNLEVQELLKGFATFIDFCLITSRTEVITQKAH